MNPKFIILLTGLVISYQLVICLDNVSANEIKVQNTEQARAMALDNVERFKKNPDNYVGYLKNTDTVDFSEIDKDFFAKIKNTDFTTVKWLNDYKQEETSAINPKSCVPYKNVKEKESNFLCLQKKGTEALFARPTVYYVPMHVEYYDECKVGRQKVNLINQKGDVLKQKDSKNNFVLNMCKSEFKKCHIEGTCFYTQLINRTTKNHSMNKTYYLNGSGIPSFELLDMERFPIGKGLGNAYTEDLEKAFNNDSDMKEISLRQAVALDPFYTVAADTKRCDTCVNHYRAGDVLFFPTLIGLLLPDGTTHKGFVIIRDTGAKSVFSGRANRFDFFTGFIKPYSSDNPFFKLEMVSEMFGKRRSGITFPFYKVTGKTKLMVLKWRNFPSIPNISAKREYIKSND